MGLEAAGRLSQVQDCFFRGGNTQDSLDLTLFKAGLEPRTFTPEDECVRHQTFVDLIDISWEISLNYTK